MSYAATYSPEQARNQAFQTLMYWLENLAVFLLIFQFSAALIALLLIYGAPLNKVLFM